MKKVLYALFLLLPLISQAQKRHEYTFDFTKPSTLNPRVEIEDEYAGAEYNLTDLVLRSQDKMVSITFDGRGDDGRGGVLVTGSAYDDESWDHYLFIARGASMIITSNGAELDSVIFSTNSYVGNLRLSSTDVGGLIDPRNESWYSNGVTGVTKLSYIQNGAQVPQIRKMTVIYRSPMDVLEPIMATPADHSNVHAISTIELTYAQNQLVKLGDGAKFELLGPQGFNSVLMNASAVGNKVFLTLPEGITIDESNEAYRGTYTLIVYEKSVIGDDDDGYYNKKMTFTFNVVEAYNKFVPDIVWPDMSDNVEKIDTIVVGFPGKINKISADELYLIDKNGEEIRTVKAKWLESNEYSSARPFFRADRDIYSYVQFVFSGAQNAAVKTSGIYHLTIPERFIWNNKYVATADDEGVSAGARFNPEFTITYNVNGVVYPSDEVLQAAKDLLAVTGAGYPAVDSPARQALQSLVAEGVGTDVVFEEAMAAFYAETDIEMPSNGYYLLSAVPSEGDQVFLSYENGSLGLTKDVEEAVHLLATVNDDGTVVFKTPDGKYISQLLPDNNNVTNSYDVQRNSLTFSKFSMDGLSPEDAFGLWSINVWLKHTDQGDITAFARVNTQTLAFSTDRDEPLKYFSGGQTNAFRLTETSAPIPVVTFSLNPALGTSVESLYHIELTFTNVQEVAMSNDAKAVISLIGSNSLKYAPTQVAAMDGARNKFMLTFDEVKAGTYTFAIPKGTFTWTYEGRVIQIPEIKGTYTVKSGVDFKYDFQDTHVIYYHLCPNLSSFNRDVDLDKFILAMKGNVKIGMSDKPVKIMDVYEQFTFAQGHLVPYSDPEYPDYTMLKFVLDKPIIEGSFEPGKYCFVVDRATFGDENYGRWLQDPQSVSKTECHVNYAMDQIIDVNNDRVNIQLSPDNLSDITRLSQITITLPYHENVEIPEDATIVARNYDYDNPHAISSTIERVEGTTNSFRFTSDEALRFSEDADARRYSFIIPKGFFKCGTVQIPSYDDTMFFYYTGGNGDVIEGINTDQQQGVIFDLAGRRVKDMNKAGIYIVGGRKVVVK